MLGGSYTLANTSLLVCDFFRETKRKATRAYAQSRQYYTIAEVRDF